MSNEKVKNQELSKNIVLSPSKTLPDSTPTVVGYDWNIGIDYHKLLQNYKRCGFQATNFGLAVEEIKRMIECRKVPLSYDKLDIFEEDDFIKRKHNCTIFLGYSSNMVSCGVRETIRFLVQHKMIDCIVTTAGGVEEDLMKCLAPTYIGDFNLDDTNLRNGYINRIGNLLVPNNNYRKFEEWIMPILDEMLQEQNEKNIVWTPSKMITRLGEKINNPESIYYWAAKNKIPVFCPALTDGSIGDMFYFHSFKNPGLELDIITDVKRIHDMTLKSIKTGVIVAGSGTIKHHILYTNSMRDGADYAVYVNTSNEFDGSDSGARPEEAMSWGKIRTEGTPVKIYAEATLVFPLLIGETFVKDYYNSSNSVNKK